MSVRLIASLALEKFARREILPKGLDLLTDRELAVFALIAAEQSVGGIAKKLGISRTTVETHCQHIKLKLGYPNAGALKRGARELLVTTRTGRRDFSPTCCVVTGATRKNGSMCG